MFEAGQAVGDGEDACIVVQQGRVAWVGPQQALPPAYASLPRHDGQGMLATPGLVDCHTHLVYGGERANEFAMRLDGASYEEVARAGGGIVSSVRATREASEDELFEGAVALAAPVFREDGIVGAITLIGPAFRCDADWRARAAGLLQAGARTINAGLAEAGPP